jgi:D-arabinono-1,4-lactone oxidase
MILSGELRRVQIMPLPGSDEAIVEAGGGCYLGRNPMDPDSTLDNSLNAQLDAQGYALPVLGGMSHQSVAGFLLSGSAGGSLRHGFADVVEEITLVDGLGRTHVLRRGEESFNAAAVSLGLFGVVIKVKLRVGKHYHVSGSERVVALEDSCLVPDSSGGSRRYEQLEAALGQDYFHLNWFPQKYVQRVMQWQGQRDMVGPPVQEYKHALSEPLLNHLAAAALFAANTALAVDPESDSVHRLVGNLLSRFVEIGDKPFKDIWHKTLPVDDQAMIDTLIKTDFTEIWIPVGQLDQAMDALHALYADSQEAAGNFACEIYGATASPYWLSPSHAGPVVRIDPYWWNHNPFGSPEKYFTLFWEQLLPIESARLHWGKFLPKPGQRLGSITFNREWIEAAYPRFLDWLALREEFDPKQTFVTRYWRDLLGIPRP